MLIPDNVLRTCKDMLEDRGHKDITCLEVSDKSIVRVLKGPTVRVYWIASEPKVTVALARCLIKVAVAEPLCHVVISQKPLTPSAANLLFSTNIEHFTTVQLQFNITKHALYYRHRMLDPEETAIISKKYKNKCMPTLLSRDVVVKYFKFPVGSIVEIDRDGPKFYRRVCDQSSGSEN